jgi:hypothetical protein
VTKSLIVDQALIAKLGDLVECLEIRDESGRTLGYFTPAQDRSAYAGVQPPASEEELQRREQEESGRALKDILADLDKPA